MRALKTVIPGVLLLTALAACTGKTTTAPATNVGTTDGGSVPASAGAEPSATTGAPVAATTAASSTGNSSSGQTGGQSSSNGATAVPCTVSDVKVEITAQSEAGEKTQKGLVALTNRSAKTCTVSGWLTLTLVNAANESVNVPTKKVAQPGPAEQIKVPTGTTVFAGIKWTTCDKGDTTCGVGNTIRWDLGESEKGPAASLVEFPATDKISITMKSLQIGTLQPAAQGVVAW